MKKKVLTGILACACASVGFAQNAPTPVRNENFGIWQHHAAIRQQQDYQLPSSTVSRSNHLQKPTDMQSRMINTATRLYDGTGFNILLDTLQLYWIGNHNQSGLDTVIISQVGLPFPFTPLNDPSFNFQYNFVNADSNWQKSNTGNGFAQYRERHFFDANGNPSDMIGQEEDTSNQWSNSFRSLYVYDQYGNCTQSISLNPQGANGWDSVMKWNYSYNAQHQMTGWIDYSWNAGSSQWDKYSRFNEGYNNGNWVTETRQGWSNNQWVNTNKSIFSYDTLGNLVGFKRQTWDDTAWVNADQFVYSYDASHKMTSKTYQTWQNNLWVDSQKFDYFYTGNPLTGCTFSIWNADSNAFINGQQFTYEYNSYGQCTHVTSKTWNGSQFVLTAGSDGQLILNYEEFNTSGIHQTLANKDFQVYPNPANEQLTVKTNHGDINNIRIVDMTGKVVYRTKGTFKASEVTLSTSQLTNGIYLLQVFSGEKIGTKTIVVRH